ncbi:FbpB family small basic protein [Salibacterium salarium]|uniref:FbpB family small basic protein n=1 Tax=Salibacterium salarium TaxID=284579 RepID=A0A428N341_9BACI|nr:FbpB family small basic protein [Salibacterium salarium]RSL32746.1 FbpB family small basic protein [Salibacterium salarium]
MHTKRNLSMKELIEANKKEIKNNPAILEQIEKKWEEKRAMS